MAKKTNIRARSSGGKPAGDKSRASRPSARPAGKVPPPPPPKKIKTPLSKSELAEFRRLLLDKRRAIVGDMNGIETEALRTNRQDGAGDLSNMPTHPADIGTDNFEQEFTLGLLESERTLLNEINEALERIDNGTYGVCLGTAKPIGLARLKARPWAKYCIDYARLIEKGAAQPGDSATAAGDADDEDEEESVEPEAETEPDEPVEEEAPERDEDEPEE